jgi:hypothetical protein
MPCIMVGGWYLPRKLFFFAPIYLRFYVHTGKFEVRHLIPVDFIYLLLHCLLYLICIA